MKRSEALKLIKYKLENVKMSETWEDQILTTVEEIGMLPPEVGDPIDHNQYWEPEDAPE